MLVQLLALMLCESSVSLLLQPLLTALTAHSDIERNVFIFDLDGGTFDVSLVTIDIKVTSR